jgi:hypothetical protein
MPGLLCDCTETSTMDSAMLHELHTLNGSLAQTFTSNPGALHSQLEHIHPRLMSATANGHLSPSTLQYAANVFGQCEMMAQSAAKLGRHEQEVSHRAQKDMSSILYPGNPFQPSNKGYHDFSSAPKAKLPYRSEGEVDYKPWRLWFLAHFANPYPSDQDKNWLCAQMPGKNNAQLLSWFSNLRKRSGWTDLNRLYAGGTPAGMQNLLDKIDSPITSAYVKEDAKRMVEKVRRHVEQGAREASNPPLAPQLGSLVSPEYSPYGTMGKPSAWTP